MYLGFYNGSDKWQVWSEEKDCRSQKCEREKASSQMWTIYRPLCLHLPILFYPIRYIMCLQEVWNILEFNISYVPYSKSNRCYFIKVSFNSCFCLLMFLLLRCFVLPSYILNINCLLETYLKMFNSAIFKDLYITHRLII